MSRREFYDYIPTHKFGSKFYHSTAEDVKDNFWERMARFKVAIKHRVEARFDITPHNNAVTFRPRREDAKLEVIPYHEWAVTSRYVDDFGTE